MLAITVLLNKTGVWKTIACCSLISWLFCIELKVNLPLWIETNPFMVCKKILLPAPFGPKTAVIELLLILQFILSNKNIGGKGLLNQFILGPLTQEMFQVAKKKIVKTNRITLRYRQKLKVLPLIFL